MKDNVLKLEELEVTSFITDLSREEQEQAQGGATPLIYASACLSAGVATAIHDYGDAHSWWHCGK